MNNIVFLFTLLTALSSSVAFAQTARMRAVTGSYTSTRDIILQINAREFKHIAFGEDSLFITPTWYPMADKMRYMLSDGDGQKRVFAKLRDEKGQERTMMTTVILDRTSPPAPTIEIEGGKQYYALPGTIKLEISLKAQEAAYYQISRSASFIGEKWAMLSNKKISLVLEEGDGRKTFYARTRDIAGNSSPVTSKEIIVDREAPIPDPYVQIDGGTPYTIRQDGIVDVRFSARGADSVLVSLNADFKDSSWMPYINQYKVRLQGTEGLQFVYVKFKDIAGNQSPVVSSSITLDLSAPIAQKFQINNGEEHATDINKQVFLDIESDAAWMMLSNHPAFIGSQWEVFKTHIPVWRLQGEDDGIKCVYLRLKDAAGNISAPIKTCVILQRKGA